MSLLYVDVKNHENLHSPSLTKQVLQSTYRKDQNLKQNRFTIDPEKIIINFEPQKSIIQKLIFLNNHNQNINFKIEPPTKNVFSIKCKKSSLNPKQSCQIFLFFSGEKQKVILQDEFIINIDKEKIQLHVPIICKPKIFKLSSNKRLSLHKTSSHFKENDSQTKQKFKTRPLILKKKKTGQIDFKCEIEHMVKCFMEKFNSIHEFVKQKNVKKQIFIGEKALSEEKHREIIAFNDQVKKHIQQKIRRKVESRLEAQFSQQGPVIRNFEGLILRWNKEKNISKLVYDKGLSKVQEQVRKYLFNLRYEKIHRIFSIYREFKESEQYLNIPEQKKHEIYMERLEKKVNKKSEASLELNFDRNSFLPNQLDVQIDVYSNRKNHIFEINPRIGFDNWIAIEESTPYTHEMMDYASPFLNGHPSSKGFSSNEKEAYETSLEINFLFQQIKSFGEFEDFSSPKELQTANNKTKPHLPSRGELSKINQAYNITGRIFSSMNPPKSFNSLPKEDQTTQAKNGKIQTEALENYLIQEGLRKVTRDPSEQKLFLPYLSTDQADQYGLLDNFYQNEEEIIINELKRPRPSMDYLKGLSFSRGQHQTSQQSRRSFLQTVVPYKNNILRKIPKEDKFQPDRLERKAENILLMIQEQEQEPQIQNYKIKGEVELQIPNKHKMKTSTNQHSYEDNFENLNLYKTQLLGKSNCLLTYLHQASKNKSDSIFMI